MNTEPTKPAQEEEEDSRVRQYRVLSNFIMHWEAEYKLESGTGAI